MIKHFYKSFAGYFDFENIYRAEVKAAHDGARFVELGTYAGKSLAFLAVEIMNSGKEISVDAYDLWTGWRGQPSREAVEQTMLLHGVLGPLRLWAEDSATAASRHDDASVDFLFIDAAHTYEAVKADLTAWWPKMKPGATFAGHDYVPQWPGVVQAVNEFSERVGVPFRKDGTSWLMVKP